MTSHDAMVMALSVAGTFFGWSATDWVFEQCKRIRDAMDARESRSGILQQQRDLAQPNQSQPE